MNESYLLELSNIGLICLERSKRAKYLSISVKPFKDIRVAVPRGVSFTKAVSFVRSKESWLRLSLERARIQEQEQIDFASELAELDKWQARRALVERLEELANLYGFTYNKVTIRNQRTRWGSCSFNNNISLNIKLVLLPEELRDFVIIHELVHTRIKNHGTDFWLELSRIIPEARSMAKKIKKYGVKIGK